MPRKETEDESPQQSYSTQLPSSSDPIPASGPQTSAPLVDSVLEENEPPAQPHRPIPTPRDRWRASIRKVIHLHRTSTFISRQDGVGAEPGIDPRRNDAILSYGHIR